MTHSFLDLIFTNSKSFKMISQTCRHCCKVCGYNFVLGLFDSIFSKSIFLLKDVDELFKLSILFGHPNFTLNTLFLALSIIKSKKKDLYYIFKIIFKIQAFILTPITILKSSQKCSFKAQFLEIYIRKNYMD